MTDDELWNLCVLNEKIKKGEEHPKTKNDEATIDWSWSALKIDECRWLK